MASAAAAASAAAKPVRKGRVEIISGSVPSFALRDPDETPEDVKSDFPEVNLGPAEETEVIRNLFRQLKEYQPSDMPALRHWLRSIDIHRSIEDIDDADTRINQEKVRLNLLENVVLRGPLSPQIVPITEAILNEYVKQGKSNCMLSWLYSTDPKAWFDGSVLPDFRFTGNVLDFVMVHQHVPAVRHLVIHHKMSFNVIPSFRYTSATSALTNILLPIKMWIWQARYNRHISFLKSLFANEELFNLLTMRTPLNGSCYADLAESIVRLNDHRTMETLLMDIVREEESSRLLSEFAHSAWYSIIRKRDAPFKELRDVIRAAIQRMVTRAYDQRVADTAPSAASAAAAAGPLSSPLRSSPLLSSPLKPSARYDDGDESYKLRRNAEVDKSARMYEEQSTQAADKVASKAVILFNYPPEDYGSVAFDASYFNLLGQSSRNYDARLTQKRRSVGIPYFSSLVRRSLATVEVSEPEAEPEPEPAPAPDPNEPRVLQLPTEPPEPPPSKDSDDDPLPAPEPSPANAEVAEAARQNEENPPEPEYGLAQEFDWRDEQRQIRQFEEQQRRRNEEIEVKEKAEAEAEAEKPESTADEDLTFDLYPPFSLSQSQPQNKKRRTKGLIRHALTDKQKPRSQKWTAVRMTQKQSGFVHRRKLTADESGLVPYATRCGTCRFYGRFSCAIVEGKIDPDYNCCNLWTGNGQCLKVSTMSAKDIEETIPEYGLNRMCKNANKPRKQQQQLTIS